MSGGFYGLALGALSVWRITHLLNAEDGPWDVLVRVRHAAGSSVLGDLLDCFYCASVWVAVPFASTLGGGWRERILYWPALSAAACLLERATTRSETSHAIVLEEDPHGLLRTEAKPDDKLAQSPGSVGR
jgi:Protein of unknown function (DUF1360)